MRILLSLLSAVMLSAGAAWAEVATKTIEYTHDGVTLEGYLAWDDSIDGPRPGVLIVHEWWGLDDHARERARQIAQMGYVAFALDMYGKGVFTNDPQEAARLAAPFRADGFALMRSRARAGLEVLAKQPDVDPNRLAAIGFCFGGTTSLQLAYDGAPVVGVVSFHGSLPPPREDDRITAKVLVLHGADDPLVPAEQVDAFTEAMRQTGVDWQLIAYGGAVHSFTNPAADAHHIPGVAYHAASAKRSWEHMRVFFAETLSRDEP